MLNMKAMPAAGGAGLAAYLWKEAASLDAPFVATTALDLAVAEGAGYEDLLALAYSERLARVQAVQPSPDHHHALHGLTDSEIDHELLWGKATDDVDAALERYEAAADRPVSGVEYRQDTVPELATLLKIDLAAPPKLEDLKNLLSARTADGEKIEGRLYHPDREHQMTMGSLALVFSADKSVSATYALATSEERLAILAAQRTAVDRAMRHVADKAGFIRSRRDGLDKRDPADLTWVQWQHHLSQKGDPQIHTHVTLINCVRSRVDGKVGTVDTYPLNGHYNGHTNSFRETYHRTLADELGKLGLEVSYDERLPAAVITNVPELVKRHFSSRTIDAEAAAAKWLQDNTSVSFADLTPKQRSAWLTQMAAKTRPSREEKMFYVASNGHAAWHARAAGQGYVPPPRFIDPKALQHAGIVHTQTKVPQRRQSKSATPQVDAHHNRGGGRFDDDYFLRRGVRL